MVRSHSYVSRELRLPVHSVWLILPGTSISLKILGTPAALAERGERRSAKARPFGDKKRATRACAYAGQRQARPVTRSIGGARGAGAHGRRQSG